ncbi:unnamed protein product [Cuscuta epithymum]|uniref:Membrane insertase YidC/Oxa/ALB C-terminal domain-containing protein n=1 Tax=Cuscuta epithymum TaxID=186058 RepID=A0AAV0FX79_9ASTE|nr:unnamed protein product [Cuscuta epithymum]
MALSKILNRKLLRHYPSLSASYSFEQLHGSDDCQRWKHHILLPLVRPPSALSLFSGSKQFLVPLGVHSFSRSFSTHKSSSIEGYTLQDGEFNHTEPASPADLILPGDVACDGEVVESILPVSALSSLLDGYHVFTGLPWWFVIASGTLAMRLLLFPLVVLQLRKLARISELLPKLPPPFPPRKSRRTFTDQFKLFFKEKRAAGCPSLLWFISSFSIQVPCFFLWITTIRRMSLEHHDGFDVGGTLWFQNLTEVPNGTLGPILPLLIAGLHFTNVQVSFQSSSLMKTSGPFALLAKYYKQYLEILSLPILFISFNLPQGSLVYWLFNSISSLLQQISLRHPVVRKKLGLPDKEVAALAKQNNVDCSKEEVMNTSNESQEMENYVINPDVISHPDSPQEIPAQNLSAKELVNIATSLFAEGKKDVALQLMRLALAKDPDYARALMHGQLQNGFSSKATEILKSCISELLINRHPAEVEDVDHLILSSQWAGVTCICEGKYEEGIAHLEKVALMKEPEDPRTKSHYYDALVLFSSALYIVGRKAEAAKYLHIVSAYDPSCIDLFKQYETDVTSQEPSENEFVKDLDNSRRAD